MTASTKQSRTENASHNINTTDASSHQTLDFADGFIRRHIGPSESDVEQMLERLGFDSLDALSDAAVPANIRVDHELDIPTPRGENEFLRGLKMIASKNKVYRSCIGMGYTGTVTPPVILRNVLENPGWYTQYTPYQAEIAQGRLEALLNFQTMIADLTGRELTNASLLDEPTAAAEAMTLLARQSKGNVFVVDRDCLPQTIAVVETRAEPLGIEVQVGDAYGETPEGTFGVLLQYPGVNGGLRPLDEVITRHHEEGVLVAVAADLLALCLLEPPGVARDDLDHVFW